MPITSSIASFVSNQWIIAFYWYQFFLVEVYALSSPLCIAHQLQIAGHHWKPLRTFFLIKQKPIRWLRCGNKSIKLRQHHSMTTHWSPILNLRHTEDNGTCKNFVTAKKSWKKKSKKNLHKQKITIFPSRIWVLHLASLAEKRVVCWKE